MSFANKRNLKYFENSSMRELYESMNNWQIKNCELLLSMSILKDEDRFCCIALTNSSEVVLIDTDGRPLKTWGHELCVVT